MLERDFQPKVITEIEFLFPDAIIMKNDANYRQGFPDLSIFFPKGRFALLETKNSPKSSRRKNQEFYIDFVNKNGGFARFINPENFEEVIRELQFAFRF